MTTSQLVFKVVPGHEWSAAEASGAYLGSAHDQRDGFIHFSAAHQLRGTLEKYYVGQTSLVLIAFNAADLGEPLKWEPSRGGDLFPHLYGALETAKAQWTEQLTLGPDDVPKLPDRVMA